jgi:hypothetical protein
LCKPLDGGAPGRRETASRKAGERGNEIAERVVPAERALTIRQHAHGRRCSGSLSGRGLVAPLV